MDYHYQGSEETFNIKLIKKAIKPSFLRLHRINFNFFLEFKSFDWVQNLDLMSRELIGQDGPYEVDTSANVPVKKSMSHEQIRKAVERVLIPLPLSEYRRQELIEHAWKEACQTFSTKHLCSCDYIDMDLDFQLILVRNHVFYPSDDISQCHMVPAADSSIQSLKRYEVDSRNITESCCCICLEDFSGREGCEALCMPCDSHVFHGDCIENWLRTSHYCPLCRFEMPTRELECFQE